MGAQNFNFASKFFLNWDFPAKFCICKRQFSDKKKIFKINFSTAKTKGGQLSSRWPPLPRRRCAMFCVPKTARISRIFRLRINDRNAPCTGDQWRWSAVDIGARRSRRRRYQERDVDVYTSISSAGASTPYKPWELHEKIGKKVLGEIRRKLNIIFYIYVKRCSMTPRTHQIRFWPGLRAAGPARRTYDTPRLPFPTLSTPTAPRSLRLRRLTLS